MSGCGAAVAPRALICGRAHNGSGRLALTRPMPTMVRPASRRREEILDAFVLVLLAVAVLCAIA